MRGFVSTSSDMGKTLQPLLVFHRACVSRKPHINFPVEILLLCDNCNCGGTKTFITSYCEFFYQPKDKQSKFGYTKISFFLLRHELCVREIF